SGRVTLDSLKNSRKISIPSSNLDSENWGLRDPARTCLLERIASGSKTLEQYIQGPIGYGIKTGLEEAFVISSAIADELVQSDPASAILIKPYLLGRQIHRYNYEDSDLRLIYTPK